ncbi:unnamed protein product [Strongylus vulgaris]|uniref:Uncharacterized protein n=1 Tax=Strongylus vulgaris TaxID=40348 RepID=A0A3P7JDT2_STRVU|nr:unnamed protein product [Strongylus vulgaris]
MSPCILEAAVKVRTVALGCVKESYRVVRCAETIKKWLEVMGMDKKGFLLSASFPEVIDKTYLKL